MARKIGAPAWRAVAALGLALGAAGCQSSTIVFDDRVLLSDVGAPGMRGERVLGRDCRWRFLTLGSPELSPSLQGALQNALDRHPEAMSLVGVIARRETTVTYVVDASCYVVEATALRPEQAAGLGLDAESEPAPAARSWQDSVFDFWADLTSWSY